MQNSKTPDQGLAFEPFSSQAPLSGKLKGVGSIGEGREASRFKLAGVCAVLEMSSKMISLV